VMNTERHVSLENKLKHEAKGKNSLTPDQQRVVFFTHSQVLECC
jgi:hypothetical protein